MSREELTKFIHGKEASLSRPAYIDANAAHKLAGELIDAGYRKLVIDDATVERAARGLYMSSGAVDTERWPWEAIGRQRQNHFKRRARLTLAAAVKEEQA